MRRQGAKRSPPDRRKLWPLQGFEADGTAGLGLPEHSTLEEGVCGCVCWGAGSGDGYPGPLLHSYLGKWMEEASGWRSVGWGAN